MNKTEEQTTETKNKEIISKAFDEVNNGKPEAFLNIMDENFKLAIIGSTPLSGMHVGLQNVWKNLISPITNALEVQPTIVIDQLVAEGDVVVVKAHGEGGKAKNGIDYNNTYCHFMRFRDGKLVESTEYLDTELTRSALEK